jgi:chemotaxis protein MotB
VAARVLRYAVRMIDRRSPAGALALVAFVAAPSILFAACVPKGKYDAAVLDEQRLHAALDGALAREKADEDDLAKFRDQLTDIQNQLQDRDQKLSDLSTSDHNVRAQLDQATAIDARLRTELERLGKNVDQMLSEKGTLAKALDEAKGRLDELRKAQAAAEARAALFQQFMQKFKKMIDAGQLKITTRNGRLVIQLPNDVLFDSVQTAIKPAGQQALVQVAQVLKTVGRSFQVAGDTDNVPIQTQRFPSNWELSTARAVEVVKLLVQKGADPKHLSACGYGEFDPIAGNDTPEGRAKNRRIEITLQPDLDELVAAPELK